MQAMSTFVKSHDHILALMQERQLDVGGAQETSTL